MGVFVLSLRQRLRTYKRACEVRGVNVKILEWLPGQSYEASIYHSFHVAAVWIPEWYAFAWSNHIDIPTATLPG